MIEVTDEMLQVLKDYCKFYISDADAIERIIELHEQLKPKPEPFVYYKKQPWGYDECDYDDEGSFPLYDAPPTREPLNETIIECIGYKYGFGTLEGNIEFTWYNSETIDFARAVEQAHGIGVTNAQPQAIPTR